MPAYFTIPRPTPAGEFIALTGLNTRDHTCILCRGTARRWLARGGAYKAAGDHGQWAAECKADGMAALYCAGCDETLMYEPERHIGGTPQWAKTAFCALDWFGKAAVLAAVVVAVLALVGL